MKKIIIPVDFSEHSEYALRTAAFLAQKNNAEIIVLHMLELSNSVFVSTAEALKTEAIFYIKLAEKKLKNFLAKDYLENIKLTPIIKHFKVFSEVNDVAKTNDADLIIMGSYGASGIKETFIGSNTEKVVRHSDIPVLVVKNNPILSDFENVVFACDFSKESIEPYRRASKFIDFLNAKMHLLYINLPEKHFKSTIEMETLAVDFLKSAEGNIDKLKEVKFINDYSIEKGILNFSNLVGADLVALATHGRKGLAHFFEGSISEDIANHSTLPVITFKM